MLDTQEIPKLSRDQVASTIRTYLTTSVDKNLQDGSKGLPAIRESLNLQPQIRDQKRFETTQTYLDQFAENAISKDDSLPLSDRDRIKKQALELGMVYYHLGEQLSPFYTAFADWAANHIKALDKPVDVLFVGRDSFPFLIAFKNRYPNLFKTMYLPTGRATLDQHLRRWNIEEEYGEALQQEKRTIADFYKRRGLNGKDVVIVDFGTQGTVERTHQLILQELGEEPFRINKMLLASYENSKADRRWGIFAGRKIRLESFESAKRAELTASDRQTRSGIHGFLNELTQQTSELKWFPTEDDEGVAYNKKNEFLRTLQEIGAGVAASSGELIKESKQRVRNPYYALSSLQELFARFSFLEALNSATTNISAPVETTDVVKRLNDFHTLYESYPFVYSLMTDFEERGGQDIDLANMIVDADDFYATHGEPPLAR